MANETQCPSYYQCGFRIWRSDRVSTIAVPMAEGDCGIDAANCPRLVGSESDPKIVTVYGPQYRGEFDAALPPGRFPTTRKGGEGRLP